MGKKDINKNYETLQKENLDNDLLDKKGSVGQKELPEGVKGSTARHC